MELAVAGCSMQFDCCTDAEIMEQYMGITFDGQPIETEEDCVAFAHAVFESFGTTTYRTSIEQGRAEYDAAAAGACIEAFRGVSCSAYSGKDFGELGDCRPFLLPKVADGGACTQDYECTSDNCEGEEKSLGEPPVDGACKPMPGTNEPCDDTCPSGHYCGSNLTTSGNVCLPLKADGAECNRDDECASDFCDGSAGRACAAKPPTCDGR